MTLYQFNAQAAEASDASSRITESGAYIGKFTMAKKVVSSQKGTQGIEFTFERSDGATANYITIYTFKQNGEQIFGFNLVCALMKILGIPEFQSQNQMIEEYDFGSGGMVKVEKEIYPQLMNKQIGVVLEKRQYKNSSGELKDKFELKTFFCPKTRRTGGEISINQPAAKVDKMVEALMSKKLEAPQQTQHQQAKQDGYQPQQQSYQPQPPLIDPAGVVDMTDDSIPF